LSSTKHRPAVQLCASLLKRYVVIRLYRVLAEASVRRSGQARSLSQLRNGVSDAVSSRHRWQLERNHEGMRHIEL